MTTIMGGNTWSGRLSGTRKDGTAYELEVVMSPVRDASGQIINYAALSRDVTDEELLASAARMMLERLGYEVTAVTSSTEAWHIFLGDPKRFDLVITDQTMPGMTGTMLAQKILRVRKDMPIILYTGHSDTVSPEKAQSLGIRAFSMKPVVRGELARTVRRVLDGGPT
jgi:DNA-binding NtrC family response regulator